MRIFSASSSVNGRFGSALTIAHSLSLPMKISKVLSSGISHRRLGLVGLFIPQPFPIARSLRKHAIIVIAAFVGPSVAQAHDGHAHSAPSAAKVDPRASDYSTLHAASKHSIPGQALPRKVDIL
jgi:hypothetical protein